MVNNNLIKLGKEFDRDSQDVKHTTNRVTKLEPIVEKCLDNVGVLYTYVMEFCTYGNQGSVILDIMLYPKFINIIYG